MIVLGSSLGPTAYWYLTRGTGVVALLLLTAITALGVAGPLRIAPTPRWPRFAVDTLHRDLSLLAIVVIVVHVVTTVLDGFAPIGLIDGIVPFHSAYRTVWLGLGTVAFDLMRALVITSLVRRRLGYRAWAAIHWLAYASWPIAVLHGLGTGSDAKQAWSLVLTSTCVLIVAALALARAARAVHVPAGIRPGALGAAVVTPVGLAVFTLLGPLHPHWAERAGTPASLLFGSAHAVTTAPAATFKLPFSGRLRGSYTETAAGGGSILDFELVISGGLDGTLRIRLGGQPAGGGLSLTGSQVDLLATGLPVALEGRVTHLHGSLVQADVTAPAEHALRLVADLQIDSQARTVSGTLSGSAA